MHSTLVPHGVARRAQRFLAVGGVLVACAASFAAGAIVQSGQTGPSFVSATGTRIRPLLGADALGGTALEVAEISFPANADSGDHPHQSTEIFYVVSGELEHIVNGQSTLLRPGMAGFVRPPDRVRHKTTAPTKAVVIWAPAGEADRVTRTWKREP